MAFNRRPAHRRRKVCVFCGSEAAIDYKDANQLRKYVSEREDSSPPYYRHLRKTSEGADFRNQACASSRNHALR